MKTFVLGSLFLILVISCQNSQKKENHFINEAKQNNRDTFEPDFQLTGAFLDSTYQNEDSTIEVEQKGKQPKIKKTQDTEKKISIWSCEKGHKQAKSDHAKGELALYISGQGPPGINPNEEAFLDTLEKYNIEIKAYGCTISPGVECYNKFMKKKISEKYGKNFLKRKKMTAGPFTGANNGVYNRVENSPKFPGGEEALSEFLADETRYPKSFENKNKKVKVSFVVNINGSLSNIKIEEGASQVFNKEARRVIKAMPKWEPGRHRGIKVRVREELTLKFTP